MIIVIRDSNPGKLIDKLNGIETVTLRNALDLEQIESSATILSDCNLILLHKTDRGCDEYIQIANRLNTMPLLIIYTDKWRDYNFEQDSNTVKCSHSTARDRISIMVREAINSDNTLNPEILNCDPMGTISEMIHELFLRTLTLQIELEAGIRSKKDSSNALKMMKAIANDKPFGKNKMKMTNILNKENVSEMMKELKAIIKTKRLNNVSDIASLSLEFRNKLCYLRDYFQKTIS